MLRPDGSLDVEHLAQLMERSEGDVCNLHRAFDVCRDPMEALEQVIISWF
ncbi:MAG: copper homeostasis protein CutC [Ruminococcus sp.]